MSRGPSLSCKCGAKGFALRKLLAVHLKDVHKFPLHRALLVAYRIEQGESLSAEDLAFFKLDVPPPAAAPHVPVPPLPSDEDLNRAVATAVQTSALPATALQERPMGEATPGCWWCSKAKRPPCGKCRGKAARLAAAGAIASATEPPRASSPGVVVLENKTDAPGPREVVAPPTPADVEKRARALLRARLEEEADDLRAQLRMVERFIGELV